MPSKKILFYYPPNKRTIAMETLALSLKNEGYEVIVLTLTPAGDLHSELSKNNISVFSNYIHDSGLQFYIKQFLFLIKFCRLHKPDYVHSHLQQVNIITVFAQYFIKAKCIIFRHHCNFVTGNTLTQNKTEKIFDKIIHVLAKKIIVPSLGVLNEIKNNETDNLKKYKVLPYLYDFSKYAKPDKLRVEKIKTEYNCELLLLFCSRFIDLKRPMTALNVAQTLISEGLNIKMIMLDDGPLRPEIEKYIHGNKLTESIFIKGHRADYIDFFAASDVLLHPSLTDASNSTVKEMGILEKCVVTCSNTGDFDEYILHGENGYLVNKNNTEKEMIEIVKNIYRNKTTISLLGSKLKKAIFNKFSVSIEVINEYKKHTLY